MTEEPARYAGPETGFATNPEPYLPPDIARCEGVGDFDDIDGKMHWREGCEHCLRRLAPAPDGIDVPQLKPPGIIAFWCPWYIGPDPGREP